MPTRPRIAVLVSLFAALLLIAGCSSSEKSSAPLPDGATLVKDSNETTSKQQSVHLELTVTGKIPELPIETLGGDLTNTPVVAAQGKASIIAFGQTFKDVDFVVADGDLYGALTPGSFTNFGPASEIYDVSKILNPDVGLANVLANFTEAKADGRETINGVDTVKVTGTVTADAVNGLADVGATGPVPATAWIKEDGDHELVQAKLDPSQSNSVQMTLTDWGKSVTVTKPAA
ncbi:lipoarabinomannan carrier protein LprG [Mycobacterium antarcticum]|uniref:LppX_LprAFG lipoprotein n=1 Tax=unclassified Mycolicibacterium TaxID=2636767 RepID=UPI002398615A|nr:MULTISPECIES: LppX_LprAFG lipoprotein [unclassified Mycolicibacterium]BDX32645.1 lipoarabinomannan carrier protein LprG [Mycolicibacterium sp. TUM20985]GLP83804.1 lipoarabinomannan carrier protein LprG [Mycolicibacterium sp. TUM20984]